MEAVLFVGLQGSGKSSFYKQQFFRTHVRINLDMLRTRNREKVLLHACLAAEQRFVIDNTNPTARARAPYIGLARAAGFTVVGYYLQVSVAECLARNAARPDAERVPEVGIRGTAAKLEVPRAEEGFDKLFLVRSEGGEFGIGGWPADMR